MLGKRPRPFLRTTSKSQLMPSNGDDIPPAVVVVEAKPVLGSPRPHHVVVGFDLGPENQQHLHGGFCESPRSVLEPNSLCAPVHDQHFRSPRSPRSALGSLLSGHHHRDHRNPCNEEVGLGVMAAMKAEGDAEDAKLEILKASLKSEHVLISGQNPLQSPLQSQGPGRVANPYPNPREVAGGNHYDDDGDDEMDIRDSIFSTASPASNCCSFDFLAMDFLSVCFFCKHHLAQGKDIYMYRGDHAFCSSECRCQQIVIDDCKERRSSAASCYPGAAAQSNNSVLVAKPAAVA